MHCSRAIRILLPLLVGILVALPLISNAHPLKHHDDSHNSLAKRTKPWFDPMNNYGRYWIKNVVAQNDYDGVREDDLESKIFLQGMPFDHEIPEHPLPMAWKRMMLFREEENPFN